MHLSTEPNPAGVHKIARATISAKMLSPKNIIIKASPNMDHYHSEQTLRVNADGFLGQPEIFADKTNVW